MSSADTSITPHVAASAPLRVQIDAALERFHAHTPLSFLHWDVTVVLTKFTYTIKAVDGRTFTQTYDYADPLILANEEPSAKTGGDGWSIVEINLHRDVRALLLLLVAQYGVTSLRATFT